MARTARDWKFWFNSFLGLAAIVVPVYLWLADFSAKAITVRLESSATLGLPADSSIHDLQIFVNGSKIGSPYVSTLTLTNTGSKPIQSSDFETPLELRTLNDSKLVTAQVSRTDPADIPVGISVEDSRSKIQPFLMNPGDKVIFSLVSTGPLNLAVHARIAGVREILFEDMTQRRLHPSFAVVDGMLALLALSLYTLFIFDSSLRTPITLGPKTKLAASLILVMFGMNSATNAIWALGLSSYKVLAIFGFFVAASIPAYWIKRARQAKQVAK